MPSDVVQLFEQPGPGLSVMPGHVILSGLCERFWAYKAALFRQGGHWFVQACSLGSKHHKLQNLSAFHGFGSANMQITLQDAP